MDRHQPWDSALASIVRPKTAYPLSPQFCLNFRGQADRFPFPHGIVAQFVRHSRAIVEARIDESGTRPLRIVEDTIQEYAV